MSLAQLGSSVQQLHSVAPAASLHQDVMKKGPIKSYEGLYSIIADI